MIKFAAPLIAFALLLLLFVKGLDPKRDLHELPSPFLGEQAPSFDLPELQDPSKRITNAAYDGKIAIVNFWATWCVGCRQEHPYLMALSKETDVPIYGIDWRDQRAPALEWLQQLGNPYTATGFDGDSRAGIDWGVYGAPETYLIGKDGRVLHKHLGPMNRHAWETDFLPLIERERGSAQ